MCGRYSLTTPPEAMARVFRTTGPLPNLPPRYNIAPTQQAPVVRAAPEARELALLRWGLVPSWSQGPDSKFSMINARAETVESKPAYRAAFRQRRCLVPADGFYEWRAEAGRKQPYFIRVKECPFAFAGLWEHWEKPQTPAIDSFTIIVTEANALLKPIHDRMPVILHREDFDSWLDPETPLGDAKALLRPLEPEAMEAYPVSTRVNSPRNDDPECIAPLGA